MALALAVIGTYGVMAYSVAQRTQEFGIRLALGASRADVLKLVLRQGLILTAAGIALGLIAAVGVTRLMTSVLFEVQPRRSVDPGIGGVDPGISSDASQLFARPPRNQSRSNARPPL